MKENKIIIDYSKEESYRCKFILKLLELAVPIHDKLNPKRKAWNINSSNLLTFSKGTLGYSLGEFYKKQHFEPIPKAERHDVFHVLLGYSTNVIDEAALQFFLLGNGKPSFLTTGTCIITSILFPFQLNYYIKAYKKGKQSTPISQWDFQKLLDNNLEQLKDLIFINHENKSSH